MSDQFNSLLEMLRKNDGSSAGRGVPGQDQQTQLHTVTPPALTGSQNMMRPPSYVVDDMRQESRSVPPPQGANSNQQQSQRPFFPTHNSNENINPASLLTFLQNAGAPLAPLQTEQAQPPAPTQQPEPQVEAPTEPAVDRATPPVSQDAQKPAQSRQVSAQDLVDQMLKRIPSHQEEPPAPAPAPVQEAPKRQMTPQRDGNRSVPPPVNPEDLVMQLFGRTKPVQPSQSPQQQQPSQPPSEQPQAQNKSTAPLSSAPRSTPPISTPPLDKANTVQIPTPPLSTAPLGGSTAPLGGSTAPLGGGENKAPIERSVSPSTSLMRMIAGSPPVPQHHQSFFPPAAPTPPSGTPQPSEPNSPSTPQTLFNYINPFDSLSATRPRNKDKAPLGKPSALRYQESVGSVPTPDPSSVPLPFSPPEGLSNAPSPQSTAEKQPERRVLSPQEEELRNSFFSSVFETDKKDTDKELLDAAVGISSPLAEQPREIPMEAPMPPVDSPAPEPTPAPTPPILAQRNAPAQQFGPAPHRAPSPSHPQDPPVEEQGAIVEEEDVKPIAGAIYTFPMKPFSALTINPPNDASSRPLFPDSRLFDIAKMPRSTDQSDRNLIAGSDGFIVYAMTKGKAGIRVIRQDDGKDKIFNKEGTDRSFNLSIGGGERLLATTVSGAVLWADLANGFNAPDWTSHSFSFPPYEEQQTAANGLLKSRARKTSKHQDVFAIGRGKMINLIHAPTARAYIKKKQQVDSKRYFAEHTRAIDTSKASKDFCFSEDDTVVASIDKAGKLKLWDVEALMNYPSDYSAGEPQQPKVLSTPSLTLTAVAPGESYRATSVMLLDKYRPMAKAMALRYAIVGMKQNYSLQLWDLALGRPVQELNFPQSNENDAMCSIAYHPPTGNIVVGNPSRNSIFLIHFSAPKYSLPPMTQAQFVNGLARKDDSVPFPDATAILSVLREYSLNSKGTLSSLDVLDHYPADGTHPSGNNPALEIFFAHSKGLASINLYKQDLSLDSDFKSQYAVNAVEVGVCHITALQAPPAEPSTPEYTETSKTNGRESSARTASPQRASSKASVQSASAAATSERAETPAKSSGSVKRKPVPRAVSPAATAPVGDEAIPGPSTTRKERRDKSKSKAASTPATSGGESRPASVELGVLSAKIEKNLVAALNSALGSQLETLRKSLEDDRSSFQESSDSKFEGVLHMVSTTLTNNVEKSLAEIVNYGLENTVAPRISNAAAAQVDESVDRVLTHRIKEQLPGIISTVLATNLPAVMRKELQESNRSTTDFIVQKVRKVNTEMIDDFGKRIRDGLVETVRETNNKRDAEMAQLMEIQRQQNAKIDQLTQVVAALSQNIQTMQKQQIEFHERVDRAQAEWETSNGPVAQPAPEPPRQVQQAPQKSPEELEREEVEALMLAGRYQDGTIKWLQSKSQQVQLFDEVLRKHMFDFSVNLSQVVILSVAAALTASFENSLPDRLAWLEAILNALNPLDENINEHVDKIMKVVYHRLDNLFEQISRTNTAAENPVLRKIAVTIKKCRELSEVSTGRKQIQHQPPYQQLSGASLRNVQGMGGYGHQQRGGWDY